MLREALDPNPVHSACLVEGPIPSPRSILKNISRMASSRRVVTLLAAATALTFVQAASATGDAFTFDIVGFNTTIHKGFLLGGDFTSHFGTTQTFANAGYDGQAYTITSSAVVGAIDTIDTIKITTPVNFLTSTSIKGVPINALQFDIGNANSGITFGGHSDPVNFGGAANILAYRGGMLYGDADTPFALSPEFVLASDVRSFSADEVVFVDDDTISSLAAHEFDFSVIYQNPVSVVPEPQNAALLLGGLSLMGLLACRRKA